MPGGRPRGIGNALANKKRIVGANVLPDEEEKAGWKRFLASEDEKIAFQAFQLAVRYKHGDPPRHVEVAQNGPVEINVNIRHVGT